MTYRLGARRLLTVALGAGLPALLSPLLALPAATSAAAVTSTAPCSAPSDTVAPAVTGLTLSATSVNVSRHAAGLTITAQVSDTSASGVPSGVGGVMVILAGPGRSRSYGSLGDLQLETGDANSGTWIGRLRIPRSWPAGTYTVAEVDAYDTEGNFASYTSFPASAASELFDFVGSSAAKQTLTRVLDHEGRMHKAGAASRVNPDTRPRSATAGETPDDTTTAPETGPIGSPTDPRLQPGWQTEVQVRSMPSTSTRTSTSPHVREGRLVGFTASPTVANSRHRSTAVRMIAKFAGHQPRWLSADFDNANRGPDAFLEADLHRTGGHWHGRLPIQQWLGNARLHITLYAGYRGNHGRQVQAFTPDILAAKGYTHEVTVISRVDHTPPVVRSLRINPDPVDATAGKQRITVTARLADRGSGVRAAAVELDRTVSISTPDGGYTETFPVYLVSLRRHGGIWSGTAGIHRCDETYTYALAVDAVDRAGNSVQIGRHGLQQIGAAPTIHVQTANTSSGPPTVTGAATEPSEVDVDFSSPVTNVSPSTISLYDVTSPADRYQSATPIQSIACFDASGEQTDCSGATDPVTKARLSVSSIVSGDRYELWANLNSVTPQLTDTLSFPMNWLQPAADFTG